MALDDEPPDMGAALRHLLNELRHIEGTQKNAESRRDLPELWVCLDEIRPHLEERWPPIPLTGLVQSELALGHRHEYTR